MNTRFNEKVDRIICPFDFSRTGSAGLEYAASLSAALGASLTIFYVQPSDSPETFQLYDDMNYERGAVRRNVYLEARRVAGKFGIKCDYAIEPTMDSTDMAVGAMSVDYDLIVMGSNGADELYQHVFGTDSHHILGLAKCPVLIIPDGYDAVIPKQIVYAFDPEGSPLVASHLESLAKPLAAEIQTLNIVPDDLEDAGKKTDPRREMPGLKEENRVNWDLEQGYSDKVISDIDGYMRENSADILALSYHHRALFEKLFLVHSFNSASRLADYPILVFWH